MSYQTRMFSVVFEHSQLKVLK